jgi:hypothetical protein
MDAKTFSLVAGVIFALVAILQLLRIFMQWTVIIGDWFRAEVGKLGRSHRLWRLRPSRVETRPAIVRRNSASCCVIWCCCCNLTDTSFRIGIT